MVKCCICGTVIEKQYGGWDQGNNAQPLADGRCCDMCDIKVIKERIRLYLEARKNER